MKQIQEGERTVEGNYGLSKYDHLILSNLQYEPPMSPEFRKVYESFAKRILWIDGNLVPGAFQMNTSWYNEVPELDPIFAEHSHEAAEIIGFFGSDPNDPYNLHGELQIDLDGEAHVISRSSLIFLPPNLPHAIHIRRVDQPIFHFSVVTGSIYNGSAYR